MPKKTKLRLPGFPGLLLLSGLAVAGLVAALMIGHISQFRYGLYVGCLTGITATVLTCLALHRGACVRFYAVEKDFDTEDKRLLRIHQLSEQLRESHARLNKLERWEPKLQKREEAVAKQEATAKEQSELLAEKTESNLSRRRRLGNYRAAVEAKLKTIANQRRLEKRVAQLERRAPGGRDEKKKRQKRDELIALIRNVAISTRTATEQLSGTRKSYQNPEKLDGKLLVFHLQQLITDLMKLVKGQHEGQKQERDELERRLEQNRRELSDLLEEIDQKLASCHEADLTGAKRGNDQSLPLPQQIINCIGAHTDLIRKEIRTARERAERTLGSRVSQLDGAHREAILALKSEHESERSRLAEQTAQLQAQLEAEPEGFTEEELAVRELREYLPQDSRSAISLIGDLANNSLESAAFVLSRYIAGETSIVDGVRSLEPFLVELESRDRNNGDRDLFYRVLARLVTDHGGLEFLRALPSPAHDRVRAQLPRADWPVILSEFLRLGDDYRSISVGLLGLARVGDAEDAETDPNGLAIAACVLASLPNGGSICSRFLSELDQSDPSDAADVQLWCVIAADAVNNHGGISLLQGLTKEWRSELFGRISPDVMRQGIGSHTAGAAGYDFFTEPQFLMEAMENLPVPLAAYLFATEEAFVEEAFLSDDFDEDDRRSFFGELPDELRRSLGVLLLASPTGYEKTLRDSRLYPFLLDELSPEERACLAVKYRQTPLQFAEVVFGSDTICSARNRLLGELVSRFDWDPNSANYLASERNALVYGTASKPEAATAFRAARDQLTATIKYIPPQLWRDLLVEAFKREDGMIDPARVDVINSIIFWDFTRQGYEVGGVRERGLQHLIDLRKLCDERYNQRGRALTKNEPIGDRLAQLKECNGGQSGLKTVLANDLIVPAESFRSVAMGI